MGTWRNLGKVNRKGVRKHRMVGPQPPIALPGWRAKKRRSAPPVGTVKSNAVFFIFFFCYLIFSGKNLVFHLISNRFVNNGGKSDPPSTENSLPPWKIHPWKDPLMWPSPNPSPLTPENQPIPWKRLYTSQYPKLYVNNGQSSFLAGLPPGVCGGYVILKDIVIRFFDYAEQNGYLKILTIDFGEKWM